MRHYLLAISAELEAKILRLYHVEKWWIGTISRQLGVHRDSVRRVLAQAGIPKAKVLKPNSLLEPFLPFILATLEKYPKLTASRLHGMVCERGYKGGPDHFRRLIALYRPKPVSEAYLRLRTLPGEQAQVDWGHFGYIVLGKAKRPLMAFVMVLSYSRKIFLHFYLNQQMPNFLRGHIAAFEAWGGIPRVLLYDNLRSAVLERQGDAIRFHPTLLEFAAHYRFEPRPVAIARGNEKGRVERAIRYVRDNFFAARIWKDLDDLNAQATHWCNEIASNRPCPEDLSLSVRAVFAQESRQLLALPDNPYPTDERITVKAGKTPYVRFDLNDYSIPHTHVRRTLTIIATLDKVFILEGSKVIAEHLRSYEKGKQIEIESHIAALTQLKSKARKHRYQDRLAKASPTSVPFLVKAAERGYSLHSIIKQLNKLLDRYGSLDFETALKEALSKDVPHPNAVRLILERCREERHQLPPIAIELPNDDRVRELVVRPHALKTYDQLQTTEEKTNE